MHTTLSEAQDHQVLKPLLDALAHRSPRLTDLSESELNEVAAAVVRAALVENLRCLTEISRIDWTAEAELFLRNASRTDSWATREAYARGIDKLDDWTQCRGWTLADLTPPRADEYIYWLRSGPWAPATVRLDVAGARVFLSFVARRHPAYANPFAGTRALPRPHPVRPVILPTPEEVETMVAASRPALAAVIRTLSLRGLRAGALEPLVLEAGRFQTWSKGRAVFGTVPNEVTQAIARAGLSPRRPFAAWPATLVSDRIKGLTLRLHRQGRLKDAYSAHDLRHFYAVQQYQASGDIYRVRHLLSHSSVPTTERYLRSIRLR